MKSTILLLALSLVFFSSCTTAYKTGQTPDDVYFSPARPQDEYVRVEKDRDREYRGEDYDDRYLRMKVRNRSRWSDFNDWYSYERYGFGYNYIYGSYNNPYTSWNYYHNPYCGAPIYVNPKTVAISRPRTFNLSTYNTTASSNRSSSNFRYTNANTRYNSTYSAPRNNTRSRDNDAGNTLRDIFRGSNSNNNNNNSNSNSKPSNTSSSSGSKSSSSSGSSAPVRRF